MFLSTSGKSADTSLPNVMAMMVFWMDSLRSYAYCETRPARSSKVSPLRGTAKAPRMRFTAIVKGREGARSGSSKVGERNEEVEVECRRRRAVTVESD
ncbi:hypothetical protein HG530_015623 [Fusarium avenaceum]|nr:hypothetical protein HG530_015623 [Fusarium avenaceum]